MQPKGRRPDLRPVGVQLDGLDRPDGSPRWFPALTTGELWNGFATPYFEKKVGDEIVDAFNARAGDSSGSRAWYDGRRDAFIFKDEDEDEEVFAAKIVANRKLYPIGAWFWAWSSNDSEN